MSHMLSKAVDGIILEVQVLMRFIFIRVLFCHALSGSLIFLIKEKSFNKALLFKKVAKAK